jgi:hypothetical protein
MALSEKSTGFVCRGFVFQTRVFSCGASGPIRSESSGASPHNVVYLRKHCGSECKMYRTEISLLERPQRDLRFATIVKRQTCASA